MKKEGMNKMDLVEAERIVRKAATPKGQLAMSPAEWMRLSEAQALLAHEYIRHKPAA